MTSDPRERPETGENTATAGARNLLKSCLGLKPGQSILLVCEDNSLNYYHDGAAKTVAAEAQALGAAVSLVYAPPIAGPEEFRADLSDAMGQVDHTVFFSRIGDQIRFAPVPGRCSKTMSYAMNQESLASDFCGLPHPLMEQILSRLGQHLESGQRLRITCPLGTELEGDLHPGSSDAGEGKSSKTGLKFTVKHFPVMIFPPLSCRGLSGRLVYYRWLASTITRDIEESFLLLDHPVTAVLDRGRILRFEGDAETCRKVEAHYERIAAKSGGDPFWVGSWHAGIHPKCWYPGEAAENLTRWCGFAFANPRYCHFHSSGRTPGELSIGLFDATIEVDGEALWDRGDFRFLEREETRALLSNYPAWADAFLQRRDCGF